MALTVNNAKWNKKQFQSNYTYKWTPGTPHVSPSISTASNTSLTVSDGATVNTTGTFGITYMNGHTTNSTNSYSGDAKLWFKINGGSWTTIKSGGIKFNTSWVSWSINKNITTSTESASATFNFKINNTTTTMNNSHLNVSKNLSSTISNIQYSKDNATWQDSNVFSSLTPNTTYTLYVKAIAKSATGETATGYGNISGTTDSNPPVITNVATSVTRTSFTLTPSVTLETGVSLSNYMVYWGTQPDPASTGTYTTSTTITGLNPNTTYYYSIQAKDSVPKISNPWEGTVKTSGNAPSYTATASSITRTSFIITPSSITYDTNASFKSFKVEWGTSTSYATGSNTNTTSAAAYTVSSLAANTTYYWRTTLTDTQGRSTQKTGSITTTGNAPTVTASTTPARTSCTLAIGATYDTNASFSSGKYEYGTSTSYGTSVNISAVGNQTISNLTPNTTYYYKVSITDNKSRTGTKTGSFKTTGNAPSITAVGKDIYRNSIVMSATVTYDTNASFSSVSIQYGTSSSYGSTSSSYTISNLNPNTTYYYSMTVTDNQTRTSTASTGSFKTTAYLPYNLTISASSTTQTGTSLTVSGSGDTNAAITNYTYYYTPKPNVNTYDMPIKSFGGARWARIFYHNNKKGTVLFTSLAECKNTQTADKYSRLGLLDSGDTYKINGKYEFLLEYPIDDPTHYNRWKQTNAPQNEFITRSETGGQVIGYEAVHIDWTSNYWGGLERNNISTTSYSPTWLDGSCGHGNWFYAIGSASTHNRGIPSYSSTADVTELWIRIPDATVSSSSMGTSTTATVTNLAANTTYLFNVSATNAAGTNYSSTIEVTTLSGQAQMTIKQNGVWVTGDVYIKVNGAWVEAQEVYIKNNGSWVKGIN